MMTEEEVRAMAARLREADNPDEPEELEQDAAPQPKGKVRRRKASKKRRAPRAPSSKPASLRVPLRTMLETVGNVWGMSEALRGHAPIDENYPTCGSVLAAQADDIATQLNTLAAQDPNVYRWLDRMLAGGGWGGVVLATWPVAQAVLAAHVMPVIGRRSDEAARIIEEAQEWPPEQTP